MADASQRGGGERRQRPCPKCGSANGSRSHRRTPAEYLRSLGGLYPYHCAACDARFYARRSSSRSRRRPDSDARWAICPKCRSTEINRIDRNKVAPSWGNLIWRIVRAQAYRCPECRNRFFALRPQKAQSEAGSRIHPEKGKGPSTS